MRRDNLLAVAALAAIAGVPMAGGMMQSLPTSEERKVRRQSRRERRAAERIAKAEAKRERKRQRNLASVTEGRDLGDLDASRERQKNA